MLLLIAQMPPDHCPADADFFRISATVRACGEPATNSAEAFSRAVRSLPALAGP
jgi:hypothetical protein